MNRLTQPQKTKYIDIIVARDGGFKCFYCHEKLSYKTGKFEHLNDDHHDNRVENLVLACQPCNIKKYHDSELRNKADEKLEENEFGIFVRERKYEDSDDDAAKQPSKEIDINTRNFDMTERFLTDYVLDNGSILFSDALDSCAMLCKKETGHGSQQSVRNYISMLTSTVGDFEVVKDKKKIIRLKDSNPFKK